jgi:RND family efflux transporter MFP subunit
MNARKEKILKFSSLTVAGIVIVLLSLYFAGVLPSARRIAPGSAEGPLARIAGNEIIVSDEDIPLVYSTMGTVRSRDEIEISSRITAKIAAIPVREGDPVRKGDIIISLEDSDLKASLAKANERFKEAQAALTLAEKEFARTKLLFEKDAASKKALDQAESGHHAALAALSASKEAIKEAEAALSYASIASPIDGIVSKRHLDPGDLAVPGARMLQVFDNSRLMLYAPISESLVSKVKLGDKMKFGVDAVGKSYEGELKEISREVDPQTRSFMVKICLGVASELMPGMFGRLEIRTGTEKALLIPETAIVRSGQLEYVVKAAKDSSQTRVLVRSVPSGIPGRLKILSGLEAGDRIIVNIH